MAREIECRGGASETTQSRSQGQFSCGHTVPWLGCTSKIKEDSASLSIRRRSPQAEVSEHRMVKAMKEAGFDPAFTDAFAKTGPLVREETMDLMPEKDLDERDAAIEE